MNTHADKTQENKSQSVSAASSQMQRGSEFTFQFVDNRPEAVAQRKLPEMANNSPRVSELRAFHDMANNSPQAKQTAQLQSIADNSISQQQILPLQNKNNGNGVFQLVGMSDVADVAEDSEGTMTHRQSGVSTKGKKKKGPRMIGAASKNPFGRKINHFARWVMGKEKDMESLSKGLSCWEAILFSAMKAGAITENDVKDAYKSALEASDTGTDEPDSVAFVNTLKDWMVGNSVGDLWKEEQDLVKGQLIIAGPLMHVAISLGGQKVMSLGHQIKAGKVEGWTNTTIDIAFDLYKEGHEDAKRIANSRGPFAEEPTEAEKGKTLSKWGAIQIYDPYWK